MKQLTLATAVDILSLLLVTFDSYVVTLRVIHFKRISCRLGISRLVIRNRTVVLHVQKAAANILYNQLCKLTAVGPSCWRFVHAENIIFLKEL